MKKQRQNKLKSNRIKSDNSVNVLFKYIDTTKVRQPEKLLDFIVWIASPKDNLSAKNQKEYAKLSDLDEDTLTNWKKLSYFYNEVAIYRDQIYRKFTTPISSSLVREAKAGNVHAIKLFFQKFENFSEKTTPELVPPKMTEEESLEVRTALRNLGFEPVETRNRIEETEE